MRERGPSLRQLQHDLAYRRGGKAENSAAVADLNFLRRWRYGLMIYECIVRMNVIGRQYGRIC